MLNFIKEAQVFIIPIAVLIITQIIKVLLEYPQKQKIKLSYLGHYGGMPSSHTALFISLTTIILIVEGWHSSIFAVTLIVCVIMIRDALGIRHHLGNHGKILKQIIKEHVEQGKTKIEHDKIVSRLGHTPIQVLAGGILGFSLTLIFYYFLNF